MGVQNLVEVEETREVCVWNRRKSGVNSANGRRGVGKRDVHSLMAYSHSANKILCPNKTVLWNHQYLGLSIVPPHIPPSLYKNGNQSKMSP